MYECYFSEENVQDLIPKEEPDEIIFPMYHSKFSQKVRVDAKKDLACHRTMGLPCEYFLAQPNRFLKKKTRQLIRPIVEKCDPPHEGQKSWVPRKHEWVKKGPISDKDYICNNIKIVNNAMPKTGPTRNYDQATNRRYHNCILMLPKYITKEGFGKVPRYILKIKKDREDKQKELELMEIESKKQTTLREVSQEERQQLIDGLKRRWTELQKEFQLLPMLNDTPPQIKRKLKIEKDLSDLEKEIDYLERNQLIFVYEAPKYNGFSCP